MRFGADKISNQWGRIHSSGWIMLVQCRYMYTVYCIL